jgi:hypothetical protein
VFWINSDFRNRISVILSIPNKTTESDNTWKALPPGEERDSEEEKRR